MSGQANGLTSLVYCYDVITDSYGIADLALIFIGKPSRSVLGGLVVGVAVGIIGSVVASRPNRSDPTNGSLPGCGPGKRDFGSAEFC